MGTDTAISWTDHTFNPWMGCSKVSPGCDHCYAEALGKRTGRVQWGDDAARVRTKPDYWRNPIKWNAAAEAAGRPALVFCASLADVFEDRADVAPWRAELLEELIPATPWLRWQLLTKRPENVRRMVPPLWISEDADDLDGGWPANVWIGTTVEDQQRAEERIPELLRIPAPVRFLSCEPLLGPVELRGEWLELEIQAFGAGGLLCFPRVDWIIVGGESGPRHRALDLDHARGIRDAAVEYDVAFFFKQVGGRTPTAGGDELDGRRWKEIPGRRTDDLYATEGSTTHGQ